MGLNNIGGGGENSKSGENELNTGFYIIYIDENNLVFLDDPTLTAKNDNEVNSFFYHEVRSSNPHTLLLILSQVHCDNKMIKSESFWEMDFKNKKIAKEVLYIPSATWSEIKENSIDMAVHDGICNPDSRDKSRVIKNTGIVDLIDKYINEYQKDKNNN